MNKPTTDLTNVLHHASSGKEVAKFCQLYFQKELVKMPEFFDRDFATALRKTFHRMDEMLEDEVWVVTCGVWVIVWMSYFFAALIICIYSFSSSRFHTQQYDYQLSQFRKLPNPSDVKPADRFSDDDVSDRDSDGGAKTGRKISTSEAVQLFEALLQKEKEVCFLLIPWTVRK